MASPTRRLLSELRPYTRYLVGGTLFMLLASPASIVPNLMWMVVVDEVIGERRIGLLMPALGVAIGLYLLSSILGMWRDRMFGTAGQQFVHDLRTRLCRKLLDQSPAYMHNQRTGDLQARVISDVDTLQSSLITGFAGMVQELYSFLLVLGTICAINTTIGSVLFLPLFVCFFIARHFNQRMKQLYRDTRESLGNVGNRLQEMLGGFLLVKAFNRRDDEEAAFGVVADDFREKSLKAIWLRTKMFPILFSFAFSTNVIMLGLGAWLVYEGQFSLGGLVALRGFWWQLNSPVRTLAQVNDMLQRALASSERIYAVLDTPESIRDEDEAVDLGDARRPIAFRNVAFAYVPEKPVLERTELEIRPGEIIGLAGSSGAGKTTILGLVARFYDPTEGVIEVGGTPLTKVRQRSWRQHLGFVMQDTFLFNTTILDNIRYGRPEASEGEVVEAARRANADDFIRDLPQGYGTLVGERGVKLSGGQRQRVGVARAFLANPEILLLDETTSSVEPESERIIQDSLFSLMKGRTVILSSHRPSLLRQADRVLFIQGGRIVEEGPHDDLMTSAGAYAEMIRDWEG